MTKLYLGVDPGRSKSGLAIVDETGMIKDLYIARMDNFLEEVQLFCKNSLVEGIVLGDGTNSDKVGSVLKTVFPNLEQHIIGEAYSTEEARKLYWQVNPPKGWKALVPLGLLVPEEPLDAYAAVVQVRRWLKVGDKNGEIS